MGMTFCDVSSRLPFACPYRIPKNGLGGIVPNTSLSQVSSEFYSQFKAAEALVPCDARAIQIYIENDVYNKESPVAVIYVFDRPVKQLKKWLRYVEKTL